MDELDVMRAGRERAGDPAKPHPHPPRVPDPENPYAHEAEVSETAEEGADSAEARAAAAGVEQPRVALRRSIPARVRRPGADESAGRAPADAAAEARRAEAVAAEMERRAQEPEELPGDRFSEPDAEMVADAQFEELSDPQASPGTSAKKKRGSRVPGELSQLMRWGATGVAMLARAAYSAVRFVVGSLAVYARRHPAHCLSNVALTTVIALLAVTGLKVNDQLISEKLGDRTISDVISASKFTRTYSLKELESRGPREFMRVGAPDWVQRESVEAILTVAQSAGLSLEHQAVLLATAEVESGFNPMATAATSTACGVFQFIRATGAQFGLSQADCMDPWKSTEAEIAHYQQNYERRIEDLVPEGEGPDKLLRMFELSYYLHHDGQQSNNPSDELKATVLAGTPFLFKAYEILEREQAAREREPSFMDKLEAEIATVITIAKATPQEVLGPLLEKLKSAGDDPDEVPVVPTQELPG